MTTNSELLSLRIIDARYPFEFEGGHIRGAENWQHGEEEQFLGEFLPTTALSEAPKPMDKENKAKRHILIFHCEFSSQRGPDFYMKLRERSVFTLHLDNTDSHHLHARSVFMSNVGCRIL